jgi:2-polyprenyl-3-methyl-5-hydroxy-6-metoxy-1,4-benzoquinol methylase
MNISELHKRLDELTVKKGPSFGKGKFYQSYEPLGIIGQRSTEDRFDQYKIKNILKPDFKVLDIGCNCGFFSLYVARYVKLVHGIEPNKALIEAGEIVSDYLKVDKCKFIRKGFSGFKSEQRYDLILSLAAHKWVKMSLEIYIDKIISHLEPNGYLFIESHHLGLYDSNWKGKLQIIKSRGFKQLWKGDSSEVGRPREFVMLRFT